MATIYRPQPGEYYVYILRNPLKDNLPFYVGKGKDGRAFEHHQPNQKKYNKHKYATLTQISNAGLELHVSCVWHGRNEQTSLWIERFVIAVYGRRSNGTGILTNLTDGGDGTSGYKRVVSAETRHKMSQAHKGKTFSRKHRANLSLANKCRPPRPSGENSKISKRYVFTDPQGVGYNVIGLAAFSREHKLSAGAMSEVANGKAKSHKGWTCRQTEQDS